MIKLIDYDRNKDGEVILLDKSIIGGMVRDNKNNAVTRIWDNFINHIVKETPEEILAMPDIEEGSKAIDWEQRRYEIAKGITAAICTSNAKVVLLNYNQIVAAADGLIRELKKGAEQ